LVALLLTALAAWCAGPAAAQPVAAPESAAGALAALPARGLAAAIAEAGSIEVPSVDPSESILLRAAQAARWTEGSYDVWHLTGGVRIEQGPTVAESHEAVVWIEQDRGPSVAGIDDEGGSDELARPPLRGAASSPFVAVTPPCATAPLPVLPRAAQVRRRDRRRDGHPHAQGHHQARRRTEHQGDERQRQARQDRVVEDSVG
jgi:hypothetical protein